VVDFGGNRAVDYVSFDVLAGTVTGLIGPNGAGKTTLFNVITGLLSPRSGRIRFDGKDITKLPPHKRAHRGLARTFQRLELFTSLTVRDNLRVAGDIRNHWGLGDNIDVHAEVDRIIELVGLQDVADRGVSEIPTGTARVVELGRALMTKPRMLLLDEPASGQTEQETEAFGRLLRVLIDEGLSVCLVEHDMTLVMGVCDQIYVLDYGKVIASGAPEAVRTNPAVIEAYLGAPTGL
jgi:branched-chain amino acid transport system ATP-binding protein